MPRSPENPHKGTSKREDIDRADKNISHIQNLVPPSGEVLDTPIGDYIESFRLLSEGDFARKEASGMQDRDTRIMEFYKFFQTNFNAQTVREALDVLRQRKVDIVTVGRWIDDGMAVNPKEYDAVSQGYPELEEQLRDARKSALRSLK